jgi:predicted 3-demethylubiquinone-9 3-methyltransferase (glyoxalase superfamily)
MSVRPFLMFQGNAEYALDFYCSVFPDADVSDEERWAEGEEGATGAFKRAILTLAGQSMMCFDSPTKHAFGFTPSISLFLECDAEEDVLRYAALLAEGGAELMPAGHYGFSRLFAWVNDKYGLSWQINCP